MVVICNSKLPVGWGLIPELYCQEALWVPVVNSTRGDFMAIVGALCVNIELSISTRASTNMQEDT